MTATTPLSPAVRITTVAAVVVVSLIAAVVSYAHMQQLAEHVGESWRSWLLPISVDGLIVAASMVLLTRHRAGLSGGPLAWGSLGVGVVASLAANMADARPEVTSVLVAGWRRWRSLRRSTCCFNSAGLTAPSTGPDWR